MRPMDSTRNRLPSGQLGMKIHARDHSIQTQQRISRHEPSVDLQWLLGLRIEVLGGPQLLPQSRVNSLGHY